MFATAEEGVAALGRTLRANRSALVALLLERRMEIPFFAAFEGAALRGLERDLGRFVDALCGALEAGRPVLPDDVEFLARASNMWTERGGRLEDITHGLRVLQRTLYEHVAALPEDVADPRAAILVGARLLELVDVSAALAGEAWWDLARHGGGARLRRELLDTLLGGVSPASHEQRELQRRLGLHDRASVLVVSADATGLGDAEAAALGALARAGGPVDLPLAADLGGEIVVLRTVDARGPDALIDALERAWRRLADRDARLRMGISAEHVLPGGAPVALAEARIARDHVPAVGGVLAVPRLTALDWLALRADQTAWRLVDPAVRRFIEDDAASGGQLLHTFRGYLAADLNLKATASRLHLHVSTVRYRLARIADRTGLDLRHVDDLLSLQIAIRVHESLPPS